MSSRYGLTVYEALARAMEAERITDEADRRKELRTLLVTVNLGYQAGRHGNGAGESRRAMAGEHRRQLRQRAADRGEA